MKTTQALNPRPRPRTGRAAFVHMRIDKATKERWQEAAASRGMTLSAWLEQLAEDAIA